MPKRIQRMKADGVPVELPVNPVPYLVDWLMEIGPVGTGGMGPTPLGWGEIGQWQSLTANDLNPWEARTLIRLSRDFLGQMERSREAACPAPYSTGLSNEQAVTDQFRAMFRFAKRMGSKESK